MQRFSCSGSDPGYMKDIKLVWNEPPPRTNPPPEKPFGFWKPVRFSAAVSGWMTTFERVLKRMIPEVSQPTNFRDHSF
jgi:hypothetical protein